MCRPLTLHLHFRAWPVSAITPSLTRTFQTSMELFFEKMPHRASRRAWTLCICSEQSHMIFPKVQDSSAHLSQRARVNANSNTVLCAVYHSPNIITTPECPWLSGVSARTSTLISRPGAPFGRVTLYTVTLPVGNWRWHLSAVCRTSDSRRLSRSLPRTKWRLVWKPVLCTEQLFFFFFADVSSYVPVFFLGNELGEQTLLPLVGRRLNITQTGIIGRCQTFLSLSHNRNESPPLWHCATTVAETIAKTMRERRHPRWGCHVWNVEIDI